MAYKRVTNTESAFFFTLTVNGWIDLFTRPVYAEIVLDNLRFCSLHKQLQISHYCLMSSHLHLIAFSSETEPHIILQQFKSFTSKKILEEVTLEKGESRYSWLQSMFTYYGYKNHGNSRSVWKRGCYPVAIYSNAVITQKIDYIHNNPVASNIVLRPEDYVYSSANPENPLQDILVEF